ncbi:DoxX family protein [Nocardioides okcheonensis]|uniref:DoxX family protein n=1 Tax=Nocardioides okcheonensis TaxID=2894081 RepID=UPI001E5FCD1A|nr:DoxX family protein [Nocardioides okcheonensis]UFN43446.1 DoxX family protein [Nocardioides okcheonensis]
MDVVLWIVAGVLALAFVAAGGMKLAQPKEKLSASGMGWVDDFSAGAVKGIGLLEVLGAVGLVLPGLTGVAPVLVPLAALGLALTMVGAAVVHLRRGEQQMVVVNAVLLVLALVVVVGRFWVEPF